MNKAVFLWTLILVSFLGYYPSKNHLLFAAKEPSLTEVKTAVLIDFDSGRVLYEKQKDTIRPIASMTKIMTLLLAFEAMDRREFDLDDIVIASTRASQTGGSQIYLKEHENIPVLDLLKAICIKSANDAAVAIAEFVGKGNYESFIENMNRKAQSLGLKNTSYRSSHGLPGPRGTFDQSTAYEIALLSRYLIQHFPQVLKWTSTRMDYFRNEQFQLINTNKLIGKLKGLDGLKTGYIQKAGWCLSATAIRNNIRLISVVMGGTQKSSRFDMTRDLLEYGFEEYQQYTIASQGKEFDLSILESREPISKAYLANDLSYLLNEDEYQRLKTFLFVPHGLKAPLKKGAKLAEYIVKLDDQILVKGDVLLSNDVIRANFFQRLYRNWNRQ